MRFTRSIKVKSLAAALLIAGFAFGVEYGENSRRIAVELHYPCLNVTVSSGGTTWAADSPAPMSWPTRSTIKATVVVFPGQTTLVADDGTRLRLHRMSGFNNLRCDISPEPS